MKASEIRLKFLKFFEEHGHTIVESSGLVPQNDPTLLFSNAGMNQFKDVFLGKDQRPYRRAATSQKCLRAGGKHNDLENVGFTARHHTFFEMLGNFSFGDYFKKDAIKYAWEFTTKVLNLPKDRLYVTVFRDDDEAAEIWHKQEGVPKERIYRLGEKDNFWAMGDTGPCGPCSELFIDRGEKYGCGKKDCQVGCDCDRYIEFWNLVFMQYNRGADGKLVPLPKPSVDTGSGLERVAAILQKADSNYDTDLFAGILAGTEKLCGKKYTTSDELTASFRVIADHARATTFLIADGVTPSNEGRGYVLRRIIRRAIRHGKKLGFTGPFMHKVCGFVIDEMRGAYTELRDKRAFIDKCVQAEEEQFFRTLELGLDLLETELKKVAKGSTMHGDIVFKLYDTYGFPVDLTRMIAQERGLDIDEPGFEAAMQKQRDTSRQNWKGSGDAAVADVFHNIHQDLKARSALPVFVGYDRLEEVSRCEAFIKTKHGDQDCLAAAFARTPFYGESGGQVGDRGKVIGDSFRGEVIDVQKPMPDMIIAFIKPISGQLEVGKNYTQTVDRSFRQFTMRNHTATHLLHWALRKTLGDHVKQAGSLVGPDSLRFDFSHFQAVTRAELNAIEDLVNNEIWGAQPVSATVLPKEQAIKAGAIAFFGEKYGNEVRVLKAGEHSVELCGGTHVANTSDIQLFKILSEGAIASGVRRIVATTSREALNYLRARDEDVRSLREKLKAGTPEELMQKLDKLVDTEKQLRRQLEQARAKDAGQEIDAIAQSAESMGRFRLISHIMLPNPEGMKALRSAADRLREKMPDAIVVLGMRDDAGKALVLVGVGPKVQSGVKAQEIVAHISPFIDGRGGGKPELAQAGGTKVEGLEEAMKAARGRIAELQ